MASDDGSGLTDILDFVDRFRRDLAAGSAPPVEHYVELYPEHPEQIRQTYEELLRQRRNESRAATASFSRSVSGVLGPYRLVRRIGAGGQGLVYLAEDTRLARQVALKVLHPTYVSSAAARERFRREATLVSRLEQPGLCGVYEAELESDTPYIAMPLIDGETLRAHIANARDARDDFEAGLTEEDISATGFCRPDSRGALTDTLYAFEQLARSLHVAHEARVVHRDIKPGNIMVASEGALVLLDFGLARSMDASALPLTAPDDVFGTPGYMSPEQLTPHASVDRRSDVYSLGVTLYEALTLQRPFHGAGQDALRRAILEDSAADPRQFNSAIPAELKVVLETALERDLARRYSTALELAEELRRIQRNEPIQARPPSFRYQLSKLVERNRRAVGALAGLFVVLLTGLGFATYWLVRARGAEQLYAAFNARSSIELAVGAADVGQLDLARRHLEQARRRSHTWEYRLAQQLATDNGRELGHVGSRVLALVAAAEAPVLLAVSDESSTVIDLERGELRKLQHPFASKQSALSADGSRFAMLRESKLVIVGRTDGATPAVEREVDWQPLQVAFTPDGLAVSSDVDATIRFLDPETLETLREVTVPIGRCAIEAVASTGALVGGRDHAAWHLPRGAQATEADVVVPFTAGTQNIFKLLPTRSGSVLVMETRNAFRLARLDGRRLAQGHLRGGIPVLSPDGQFLAETRGGNILLRHGYTGRSLGWLAVGGYSTHNLGFASHGSLVSADGPRGRIRHWDLRAGTSLPTAGWVARQVALGPTRGLTVRKGHLVLWDPLRMRELAVVRDCPCSKTHTAAALGQGSRFAIAGDFTILAASQAVSRVLAVYDGEHPLWREHFPDRIRLLAFSPDGDRLAAAAQRKLHVFDAASGAPLEEWSSDALSKLGRPDTTEPSDPSAPAPAHAASELAQITSLTWSADGELIVALSRPGTPNLASEHEPRPSRLVRVSATGEARWSVAAAGESTNVLAVDPAGRWLASAGSDGAIHLWDVDDGRSVASIPARAVTYGALAFHPLEPRLAATAGSTVRLWDLSAIDDASSAPAEVLALDARVETLRTLQFYENGETLAVAGLAGMALLESRPPPTALAREREAARRARSRALHLLEHEDTLPRVRQALTTAKDADDVLDRARFHELANGLNTRAWLLAARENATKEECARALALSERALELDPRPARYWNTNGFVHLQLDNYERALESIRRSDEINCSDDEDAIRMADGSSVLDLVVLARAYAGLGEFDAAERTLVRAKERLDALDFGELGQRRGEFERRLAEAERAVEKARP